MRTRLQIDDSFWCMLAVLIFLDTDGIAPVFLLAAAVHELGHLVMVLLCGGTITSFRLSAAGGMLRYHLPTHSRRDDFLIAAAGPITGLVFAVVSGLLDLPLLAGAGILLNGFNLLPIAPLDGGRMLECILDPMHPLIGFLAAASFVLLFMGGIYAGTQQNGWGLCLIAILLLTERRLDLQSVCKHGKM